MSEQHPIVEGECYQPSAKKLGIKQPDPPPPALKRGWVYAGVIVFVLAILAVVLLPLVRR